MEENGIANNELVERLSSHDSVLIFFSNCVPTRATARAALNARE